MFIIAVKTGHSIPERLFGKENGHEAGSRRSRGREEAGRGCPRSRPGTMLPSAQRKGGRAESVPSAAQGAWRGQGASPGPGVMLVGAQVGSLCRSGDTLGGWVGGWTGVPDSSRDPRACGALEPRKDPAQGHADPSVSHHTASTVTHHASPTASHRATAAASHCPAPTVSHPAAPTHPTLQPPLHPPEQLLPRPTVQRPPCPATQRPPRPTTSHPTAPTATSSLPSVVPYRLQAPESQGSVI